MQIEVYPQVGQGQYPGPGDKFDAVLATDGDTSIEETTNEEQSNSSTGDRFVGEKRTLSAGGTGTIGVEATAPSPANPGKWHLLENGLQSTSVTIDIDTAVTVTAGTKLIEGADFSGVLSAGVPLLLSGGTAPGIYCSAAPGTATQVPVLGVYVSSANQRFTALVDGGANKVDSVYIPTGQLHGFLAIQQNLPGSNLYDALLDAQVSAIKFNYKGASLVQGSFELLGSTFMESQARMGDGNPTSYGAASLVTTERGIGAFGLIRKDSSIALIPDNTDITVNNGRKAGEADGQGDRPTYAGFMDIEVTAKATYDGNLRADLKTATTWSALQVARNGEGSYLATCVPLGLVTASSLDRMIEEDITKLDVSLQGRPTPEGVGFVYAWLKES